MISTSAFVEKHRIHERDFTCNRCLTLPVLISYCLNMVKGSTQSELNRFFQIRHQADVPTPTVTAAAFFKARLKFSATAFIDLNRDVTNHFYQQVTVDTWNGYRLLAVDGVKYHLPDEDAIHTVSISSQNFLATSVNNFRLIFLYD